MKGRRGRMEIQTTSVSILPNFYIFYCWLNYLDYFDFQITLIVWLYLWPNHTFYCCIAVEGICYYMNHKIGSWGLFLATVFFLSWVIYEQSLSLDLTLTKSWTFSFFLRGYFYLKMPPHHLLLFYLEPLTNRGLKNYFYCCFLGELWSKSETWPYSY